LGAYDLYLRGYAMMLSPARRVTEVAGLLDQAIACDPEFGPALALAAAFHMNSHIFRWSNDPEDDRRKGLELGRRALLVAADDPTVLVNAAGSLGYFGEDINAMIALVDRALALNPSFARGWHASGLLRLWAGQLDLAIEHERASLRLSPRTRVGWALNVIGAAQFCGRRFEEAIQTLVLAIQEDPNAVAYRGLIASYAHLGRLEEAREALRRLRLVDPVVIPPYLQVMRIPEYRDLLVSGLRLALGEEAP
jgi:adenylate cyclase